MGRDKLLLPNPYEGVKLLKGDAAHTQPQKYFAFSEMSSVALSLLFVSCFSYHK